MSISNWVALCAAAGFDVKRLSAMDAYLISGKILHDSVVHENKRQIAIQRGSCILPLGSTKEVVEAMSTSEKEALRQRVSDRF